jgi:futalosine hydrolase
VPESNLPERDLLVCAATMMELQAFGLVQDAGQDSFLTGVGIPLALAQTLTTAARLRPKRILNFGIAGAYPGSGLQLGDIVIGLSELYGDVGFELPVPPSFQHISRSEWGGFYHAPLPLMLFAEFPHTHFGNGCTVNQCAGTEETGRLRETLFQAAFETMEGAAVAQAGQRLGIPVCEIRAISNFASTRDMRPENIQLALANLTAYFNSCRENTHA